MAFNREPQCKPCMEDIRNDDSEENHAAIRIWLITENQVIAAGMGGIIGVNHLAVWKAIDEFQGRVENRWRVFEKVLRLHSEITMEEDEEKESG